ncbi:hypothetical protein L2E82_14379 [Cichorium intybus]|uniref:Uncharacterized protein n=1 Tax=Cichorium intybus TaxID=13427 RepID=A0ACB9EZU1_CICIN|nr:hypothetical protein L2E82_14379 [Cichorium intybus]
MGNCEEPKNCKPEITSSPPKEQKQTGHVYPDWATMQHMMPPYAAIYPHAAEVGKIEQIEQLPYINANGSSKKVTSVTVTPANDLTIMPPMLQVVWYGICAAN